MDYATSALRFWRKFGSVSVLSRALYESACAVGFSVESRFEIPLLIEHLKGIGPFEQQRR
jgi:hypothetical protein